MNQQQIEISRITINDRVQQRVQLDEKVIFEYFEEIQGGQQFPPLTVFDDGQDLILADGWHRYEAFKLADNDFVDVEIIKGTERDAILYAVGANADHGLRRTNADKRYAVETLLKDDEWGQWSDGAISRKVNVSQAFVSKVRRELTQNGFEFPSERICSNGRSMDTSNIGQREPDNSEIEQPEKTEASETESSEPSSGAQDCKESDAGDDEPTDKIENEGQDSESRDNSDVFKDEQGAGELVNSDNHIKDGSTDSSSDDDQGATESAEGDGASTPVAGSNNLVEEQPTDSVVSGNEPKEEPTGLADDVSEEDADTEEKHLIDNVEGLQSRICELEEALKQKDEELRLKNERIAELEKQVDELRDDLQYYKEEIKDSIQDSMGQGSGSAHRNLCEPVMY